MAKYVLSEKAENDIFEIWTAISEKNEDAADRLVMKIIDKLELAAELPNMGAARPEINKDARILIVGSYIILYKPMPYGLRVAAVVYGSRDPETWLGEA